MSQMVTFWVPEAAGRDYSHPGTRSGRALDIVPQLEALLVAQLLKVMRFAAVLFHLVHELVFGGGIGTPITLVANVTARERVTALTPILFAFPASGEFVDLILALLHKSSVPLGSISSCQRSRADASLWIRRTLTLAGAVSTCAR